MIEKITLSVIVTLIVLVMSYVICLGTDFLFGVLSWTLDLYIPAVMAAGALIACILLWDNLSLEPSETE